MIETKFKNSEVGLIPEDWAIKTIDDTFDFCTNTINLSEIDIDYYVGTENMLPNRMGIRKNEIDLHYSSVREYCKNDILLSNIRPYLKKIWMADRNGGCSTDVLVLRQKDKSDNTRLLYYYVSNDNFFNEVNQKTIGTKMPRGDKKHIKTLRIPFPPTSIEQSRIAAALSDIDDLIATTKKLIKKKRNIKEGAMQELLSGKRRLPGFTEEWVEKELGNVAQIKTGYAFKSSTYTKTGDYKIITIANVQNSQLDLSEYNVINEPPKDLQEHQILKIGDILISMTGNVGRVCMVSEYACLLNQRVGIIVPISKNIDKNFLYIALTDKVFEKEMIKKGHGAAQPNIGNRDIESYIFSIPFSIVEQQAIAKVLFDMDSEIQSLEARLTKYQSLKQGMMQQLLTGKIRLI